MTSLKTARLKETYFLSIPKNMRSFEVSSGCFSVSCTADIVLDSVDAELGDAERLGENSTEDSTDDVIAAVVVYEEPTSLEHA